MRQTLKWLLVFCLVLTSSFAAVQHWRNSLQRGDREGWFENSESAKTAREAQFHGEPVPVWTNHPGMTGDVFTFARVRYTRQDENRVWWKGGYWYSDMPDSDLNLSYRLQQLTSLKADPNGRIIDLNDPELFNYPFIYMVEPGLMTLEEDEIPALRRYLLNGGFLMADDFWCEPQWANFEREIKRVFPERTFSEVETNHPLFSVVFPMARPKEQLQVPNVILGKRSQETGVTWEVHEGATGMREPCQEVHFRALFDDKNRLMVFACFNTDYGDGWDREGEDEYFFRRFAEGISYPMAINILFYVMTH